MQTAHIIRYLRRIAAAHQEELPHRIELAGRVFVCRDAMQAELIRRLFEAWTRDYVRSSTISSNATTD